MSWAPFRWFRPTWATVSPTRVRVAVDGVAAINVTGDAHGWVRCERQIRPVHGPFALAFSVRGPAREFSVAVTGFGGRVRQTVQWAPAHDLHVPVPPTPRSSVPRLLAAAASPAVRVPGIVTRAPAFAVPGSPRLAFHLLRPVVALRTLQARYEQLRRDSTSVDTSVDP